MSLFIKQDITLNSGLKSGFKIECDALTDEDIECLAHLISKTVKFSFVVGVPTGGLRLAKALEQYRTPDYKLPTLICDDVLTTGGSMEREKIKQKHSCIGAVIFARGRCPNWVTPLLQLNPLAC